MTKNEKLRDLLGQTREFIRLYCREMDSCIKDDLLDRVGAELVEPAEECSFCGPVQRSNVEFVRMLERLQRERDEAWAEVDKMQAILAQRGGTGR